MHTGYSVSVCKPASEYFEIEIIVVKYFLNFTFIYATVNNVLTISVRFIKLNRLLCSSPIKCSLHRHLKQNVRLRWASNSILVIPIPQAIIPTNSLKYVGNQYKAEWVCLFHSGISISKKEWRRKLFRFNLVTTVSKQSFIVFRGLVKFRRDKKITYT